MNKVRNYLCSQSCLLMFFVYAGLVSHSVSASESQAITQAALDYLESQHQPNPEQMARALHPQLAKRTYWRTGTSPETIMQTSYDDMLWVAENYNVDGDKFPAKPRKEVIILDVDQRVASVKLVADDWIDYMHLFKNDDGQWQVINVLWQYHDVSKHKR